LGAGGSARAVVWALLQAGWQVTVAARRMEQAVGLLESINLAPGGQRPATAFLTSDGLAGILCAGQLIVNATSVGMTPKIEYSPWPEGLSFPVNGICYDLVYNPRETLLVKQARAAGLRAVSGLGMLVEQAALGFEIWTGRSAPRDAMFAAVEA
jgi:shikimate dehydrogenase